METNRMKIVNVPVSEIVPYENNPRINEGAVEQLAEHDAGTLDLSIDQQVHFSPG